MDQYIGKLLDNRYELLERIGVGGMSVVYKARCHRLNRFVAVKILKQDLASDADFRRRFHDESQAVAMLSHPNIVGVYDVSHSDDLDYIVMELIDGITLKQYMQKRGVPLNWREALHFTIQIVKALGHAHSRGIIHRDIKPHNVMVLRDGSIKVADFGIARLVSGGHSTLTQEALGSVHYISPEQAKGSHIDGRSDLYSAGVVLYEMVTGRLPFEGDSPVSVAIQHINSIPISPRDLNPELPEALETIIMKAMAPNAVNRYLSADDMLADLEEFRKNPGIVIQYSREDIPVSDTVDEPTQVRTRTERDESTTKKVEKAERIVEDEPEEYYVRERRSNVAGTLFAILMILMFIGGIGLFLWKTFFSSLFAKPVTYEVPDLTGMTLSEIYANKEIINIFQIEEGDPMYSDDFAIGEVVKQVPVAGTTVKEANLTITIFLNAEKEEEEIRMPDVLNWDQRQALAELQDKLGLVVEQEQDFSDTVTEGHVMRQAPIANTILKSGDTVTIVISLGPKVEAVTVPLVENMMLEEAILTLESFGLTPGSVTKIYSEKVEAGRVVLQSVKASSEVSAGTVVNLQVSLGSVNSGSSSPDPDESSDIQTTTYTKEISLDLSGYEGIVHLRVIVGGNTVMNGQVDSAIGVWCSQVSDRGTKVASYYVDNKLVKTETITFA